MNATLIASLAGVATALCWGTSDWLSAKSAKHLDPLEINLTVQGISLVLMAVLFLFSGIHIYHWSDLVHIGVGNLLLTASYWLFVKALSSGPVGIVVPLSNIYPLFTIILAAIFLSARFELHQLLAMVGIVMGAAILAYEKNVKKIPLRELHKDTVLALMVAAIWGAGFFVLDPAVKQVPWQTVSIVGEIFSFSLALVMLVAIKRRQSVAAIKHSIHARLPLLVGALGVTGITAIYLGGHRAGSLIIPTVISAGGPLVASFWGAVFDKEKIGWLKRAGAVIVVGSIILLNVT